MNYQEAREQFAATMARELPPRWCAEAVVRWCAKTRAMAATHQRLMLEYCNDGLDERQKHQVDRVRERLARHCEPANVRPVFSGDPRGCTVKLQVPSGRTQDWGEVGVLVPTR